YEWIFKNLSLKIPPACKVAITGSNGSGKSTFLKCLSGQIPLTEGSVSYWMDAQPVAADGYYALLAVSAPYLELPEEFTLKELLAFHFKFKTKINGVDLMDMPK